MTDEQLMQQAVALGREAEGFIKSSLGRALLQRAKDEIAQAVEELKEVEPTDAKMVQHIQNRIWRAESFVVWLAEIVQVGTNMEAELNAPGDGE